MTRSLLLATFIGQILLNIDLRDEVNQLILFLLLSLLCFLFAEEDGGLMGLLLIFTLLTLGIAMAIVIFCHHDATCHELLSSLSS